MYVDGVKVAEGPVTAPEAYLGWWRVGYGAVPNAQSSPHAELQADVDAVAVYPRELSASRIAAHYGAR
jgi:hypothetical protein